MAAKKINVGPDEHKDSKYFSDAKIFPAAPLPALENRQL